ncbi:MAG: acyl-CoA synthetase FdrA [Anaerolineaceae bacterium]|nr:acyl-CoA synthetase FdrA [Anaerolineaceae bacterium]
MPIKSLVKISEYHDSVSLMLVAREISEMQGVQDASVVMATPANKSILDDAGLLTAEANAATPNDLVISVQADSEELAEQVLSKADRMLKEKKPLEQQNGILPKSIHTALAASSGTNIAVISVAGRFATAEAWEALQHGLHVLLFSDNVSLEDEIALKKFAREEGLLLMGPGAGTTLLNGVGLGFANQVPTGNIGIVSAAGTGLQEVSSLIAGYGLGVSQGIGVGGRDTGKQVGGIMTLEAIKALQEDDETEVLVLISKPPDPDVSKEILKQAARSAKTTIICYLGLPEENKTSDDQFFYADNLQEAALLAAYHSGKKELDPQKILLDEGRQLEILAAGLRPKLKADQHFIRGLYSGGTLCYESQIILKELLDSAVYSNAPLPGNKRLPESIQSLEHSFIDLGEEEFTVGRPHPMIDFDLRNRRILQEAADPEVAVILLDIVLGHGAHPDPAGELLRAIVEAQNIARQAGKEICLIASLTATQQDPQNLNDSKQRLESNGVIVLESNAAAARLSGLICRKSGEVS